MDENFAKGVAALKAGDRATARQLLAAVVRQTPEHIQAWLWLAGAVEKDEERIYCLRQVLKIDPGNQAAAAGLAKILEKKHQPKPQTEIPAQPATIPPPPAQSAEKPAESLQPASPEPAASITTEPQQRPVQYEPVSAQALPIQPAVSSPTGGPMPPDHPNYRFMGPVEPDSSGRRIFQARPSLAPTLIGFWVMFFIVWGMNSFLEEQTQVELTIALMTCGVLGVVILYMFLSVFLTKYELTTRQLSIAIRGKRTIIPLRHILDITQQQGWLQKLIQTGDIVVEASVNGELCRVRMRHVTKYQERAEQIRYLVQEQA